MNTNAPIILFAFKRINELKATVTALQANYLAAESELYIFQDAPKPEKVAADGAKVAEVRAFLDSIAGFKAIHRDYADTNIGCADSIIRGITQVLNIHETAIIVEDDLITSPNFLDYMNQCLKQYKSNRRVYSIAGYTFPFPRPADYKFDAYFVPRHSPWGWATWADRWHSIDWTVADYKEFAQDRELVKAFEQGGADLGRMLRRQMEGEIDAWDIRYCYSRFKANGLTIYPAQSKVQNIGFGEDATHTDVYNRYKTELDAGTLRQFTLPPVAETTPYYHKKTLQRYSFATRLYNRLKTYAGMR